MAFASYLALQLLRRVRSFADLQELMQEVRRLFLGQSNEREDHTILQGSNGSAHLEDIKSE